jgi:hypothetical protein
VPDGSQWLASGTLYSKNMLISGKNRAVASTYFKADATAPSLLFFVPTDFPLHLIHCLCKGLEQEIEPASLFFAIVFLKRIAQRIQIVEFFSHTDKIFR